VEQIAYKGWPTCYRLSNGLIDLIVTGDVGPRIIRLGFVGEGNEFKEFDGMLGLTGGDEWRVYGGHRLWHAPEMMPRTYWPDNVPIEAQSHSGVARFVQPVEATTGIQKEIDIRLFPDRAGATVTHRLWNRNLWPVELAPWALSVMAPGGVGIVPLPPRGSHAEHLLPTGTLALWAYTDMADPRWRWGTRYVLLRQDEQARLEQKIGVHVTEGWVAYARQGHLFVKTFTYVAGAVYPDLGCPVELFTNSDMLEVETLGPVAKLEPGAAVEHVEEWHLFRDVPAPADDDDVDRYILPKVKEIIHK
jgi:hypothetical protein